MLQAYLVPRYINEMMHPKIPGSLVIFADFSLLELHVFLFYANSSVIYASITENKFYSYTCESLFKQTSVYQFLFISYIRGGQILNFHARGRRQKFSKVSFWKFLKVEDLNVTSCNLHGALTRRLFMALF